MIPAGLHSLDGDATLWINSLHTAALDSVAVFLSSSKVWIPFYILLIAYMLKKMGWKKSLVVIGAIGLSILFCDQLSNLFKTGIGRLRPCYNTDMLEGGLHILEKRGGFFGFFSAHAANHFALALCTITAFASGKADKSDRAYTIFILIWAAAISASRILVGKHYLGDVLVGAAIGCIIGALLGMLASRALKRLK